MLILVQPYTLGTGLARSESDQDPDFVVDLFIRMSSNLRIFEAMCNVSDPLLTTSINHHVGPLSILRCCGC